ncbi:hypothetical protein ABQF34_10070 [Mycolicibacterium boenickei]
MGERSRFVAHAGGASVVGGTDVVGVVVGVGNVVVVSGTVSVVVVGVVVRVYPPPYAVVVGSEKVVGGPDTRVVVDGSVTVTLVGARGVGSGSDFSPQATATAADPAIAASAAARPTVVVPRFITPPTTRPHDADKSGGVWRE